MASSTALHRELTDRIVSVASSWCVSCSRSCSGVFAQVVSVDWTGLFFISLYRVACTTVGTVLGVPYAVIRNYCRRLRYSLLLLLYWGLGVFLFSPFCFHGREIRNYSLYYVHSYDVNPRPRPTRNRKYRPAPGRASIAIPERGGVDVRDLALARLSRLRAASQASDTQN